MVSRRLPSRLPPEENSIRFVPGSGGFVNLAQYDRKRMAVITPTCGEPRVLRGSASYLHDKILGNCLRIDSQEDPGMELFLKEDEWTGTILRDENYGCDFCVFLDDNCCAN